MSDCKTLTNSPSVTDICQVEKYDLSSVSAIICAAAPLSKEIQSQLFARTKVDRSPKILLGKQN